MPKRKSVELGYEIPPSLLASRSPRERTEVKRFDATPAEKQPRKKVPSSKEKRMADAEGRLEEGAPMERCGAVLDLLELRPDSYWFADPVPVDLVPDYLEIIDEPCDYATVRHRLRTGQYGEEDVVAFAADVRRIFTNAVKYNWKPDHDCHKAARSCLRAFEHYFGRSRGLDSGTLLEESAERSLGASSTGKEQKKGKGGAGKKRASMGPPSGGGASGGGSDAPPKKRGRVSIDPSDVRAHTY